ncbi:MAG: trypsin-like serine peptidase [Planctomycetota bacterium]
MSSIALKALGLATVFLLNPLTAQVAAVIEQDHPVDVDSGYWDHAGSGEAVVYESKVRVDDASIIRLHFGVCNLPAGSRMEITSLEDGAMQRLDGISLVNYANSSAFFNGSEVSIKLIAGPGTQGNRLEVIGATATEYPIDESICGFLDDRSLSSDNRQGRLSSGCTGWMIGKESALSAGHCGATGRNMILSFKVPLSATNGALRASSPNDQYPYQVLAALANGVGADYGVARVGPNSNTGLFPPEAYGEGFYQLAPPPESPLSQIIRITGYGSVASDSNLPRTHNQVQKTHFGPMRFASTTSLQYATDTTGGNSGSPVIHENTGAAIGIHTHGGCGGGGANSGTRIDLPGLLGAMSLLASTLDNPPQASLYGQGCESSKGIGTMGISGVPVVGGIFSLDLDNLPIGMAGGVFMGFSKDQWAAAGVSLPLDMGQFGFPGCELLVSPDRFFPRDTWIGTTNKVLQVPTEPTLIGLDLYLQYIFVDLFIGGLLRTTNAVEIKIGG